MVSGALKLISAAHTNHQRTCRHTTRRPLFFFFKWWLSTLLMTKATGLNGHQNKSFLREMKQSLVAIWLHGYWLDAHCGRIHMHARRSDLTKIAHTQRSVQVHLPLNREDVGSPWQQCGTHNCADSHFAHQSPSYTSFFFSDDCFCSCKFKAEAELVLKIHIWPLKWEDSRMSEPYVQSLRHNRESLTVWQQCHGDS